jgi:TetR/AcrR family transcriptional repressor of nem operon
MARTREFDIDDALQKAMEAFWAHGYAGTSIQDLVNAMGIERGSLYNTFGDKQTVFRMAFERYDRRRLDQMSRDLPPLEAIRHWFQHLVDSGCSDRERKGCLLINTALELEQHDPEVQAAVESSLRSVERFFEERIAEGQKHGFIDRKVDPGATAQTLLALVAGIRVLARVRPERQVLQNVADTALSLLR